MPASSSAPPPKPLALPQPWDAVAVGYDQVSRAYMEQFSVEGLRLLSADQELPAGSRWLDVACGPGTTALLCAEHVAHIDAVDFSENMLAIFSEHLEVKNLGNVSLHLGDGQNLPFSENAFDFAVSMFGLMFFPDRVRGMSEMCRVLVPGGKVLISSWAPLACSSAMQALFEAVRAMAPERPAPAPDPTSLENPDVFRAELEQAGFINIELTEVECFMELSSVDQFWDDMVRGAVPLLMMKKQLGDSLFEEQSKVAKQRLHEVIGARTRLSSIAHLAVAQKPLTAP